jgi:hypothetical protein
LRGGTSLAVSSWPFATLGRPTYPRIPYLPKGSEGAGNDGQPWRWSIDDQARRHAEDDIDRYCRSVPPRPHLRDQVTFDAPLSVLREAGTGLSRRPLPGQHHRDPGAINRYAPRQKRPLVAKLPLVWPFLMNKPPS